MGHREATQMSETNRARLLIAGLMSFGILLSACEKAPESQKTELQQKQEVREDILNRASVVCRDGTQYIFGFYKVGDRGGPFVTPYIVNGHFMSCDGTPESGVKGEQGTKK